MKTGVLASGSGTNLQALIHAWKDGSLAPAELVVVGANIAGCLALERAQKAGIATFVLSHKTFAAREDFDRALAAELRDRGVELVVLAGFMRVLTGAFLDAFPQRVLNIHPALLPAFPGIHAQKQALDHGVKLAGCTVHFVDKGRRRQPGQAHPGRRTPPAPRRRARRGEWTGERGGTARARDAAGDLGRRPLAQPLAFRMTCRMVRASSLAKR